VLQRSFDEDVVDKAHAAVHGDRDVGFGEGSGKGDRSKREHASRRAAQEFRRGLNTGKSRAGQDRHGLLVGSDCARSAQRIESRSRRRAGGLREQATLGQSPSAVTIPSPGMATALPSLSRSAGIISRRRKGRLMKVPLGERLADVELGASTPAAKLASTGEQLSDCAANRRGRWAI